MSAVVFIPLTQGKVAVIDFDDFEKVRPYKWCAIAERKVWYAQSYRRGAGRKGKHKLVLMHRVILSALPGFEVDHKDGNGLNNQKDNIRVCSPQQNRQAFKTKNPDASSRFRGVSWNNPNANWNAHIKKNGKKFHIGCFQNEEDAARAYDGKARELFGEYASPNFPI